MHKIFPLFIWISYTLGKKALSSKNDKSLIWERWLDKHETHNKDRLVESYKDSKNNLKKKKVKNWKI